MILGCPRCGKDDVVVGIDLYYCPNCMARVCDDCLGDDVSQWKCPDCGAKIEQTHLVRAYHSKHGILPGMAKSKSPAKTIDSDKIRRQAQQLAIEAQDASNEGRYQQAKDTFLKSFNTIKPLIKSECRVSDIELWSIVSYNYAFQQGIDAGIETTLFDLGPFTSSLGDYDVQKGYEVIADVCQVMENNLDQFRELIKPVHLGRNFQLLGIFECAKGKLAKGIKFLELSIELLGNDEKDYLPITYDALGMAYYHSQNLQEAVKWCEKAASIKDNPSNIKRRKERWAYFKREFNREKDTPTIAKPKGDSKWSFAQKGKRQ